MIEFLKSLSSLSLALGLLPLKQIENALASQRPGESHGPAVQTMDAITKSVVDQFGGTLQATFAALDNVQRGIIAIGANVRLPRNVNESRNRPESVLDASNIPQPRSRISLVAGTTESTDDPIRIDPPRRSARYQAGRIGRE